jgi:hypothetical protein
VRRTVHLYPSPRSSLVASFVNRLHSSQSSHRSSFSISSDIRNQYPSKPTPSYATTMVKLASIVAAAIAASTAGCHAFIAPVPLRATGFRLGAKLEGREIEGALTPTNNFVLVKVAAIQDQTEGGIILTGSVSLVSPESNTCSIYQATLIYFIHHHLRLKSKRQKVLLYP